MDNTLLVSLSQQLAAYRSMDMIANNLANLSTPAYKRESMKFETYMEQLAPGENQNGPQTLAFVQDTGAVRDLTEGRIEKTDAPFDLAISGKGYFTIQTPQGNRYTRNGHFTLDADGQIVTSDSDPLIGEGGPITITPDDGDIHIASDGMITGAQGELGRITVVNFADERALQKEGSSLYATNQQPIEATDATIHQGMLESSNVEPVLEISHMLDVTRAYQEVANLTKSHQDLMREAIDKLGSPAGSS